MAVVRVTVAGWRGRYIDDGLAGIEQDGTRPERAPRISERKVKAIVKMTTRQTPADAAHATAVSLVSAKPSIAIDINYISSN
ncbi:MAG: helix-turn-helix domain-containing protein [Pseudomonadota bacterium]